MRVVTSEVARRLALFHLASKSALDTCDSYTWSFVGSEIASEPPLLIHDLTGTLLYYDFFLHKGRQLVGRVRVCADKDLGMAVDSIDPLEHFPDLSAIEKKAEIRLGQAESVEEIISRLLICYNGHKLGIRLKFLGAEGAKKTAVYDIFEEHIVGSFDGDMPNPSDPIGDPEQQVDGVGVGSILDETPDAGRLDPHGDDTDEIDQILDEILPKAGLAGPNLGVDEYETLRDHFANNPPAIALHLLPIDKIAQDTPVYCGVASAQMILRFYGFEHSQSEIAEVMGTTNYGTSNANQRYGYKKLSNNQLVTQFDRTPTFEEAKGLINAWEPMKSGISGEDIGKHARVCRGWKEYVYLSRLTGEILRKELWYLINDPYPVGEGAIRWENANNPRYTNFIYVNRKR